MFIKPIIILHVINKFVASIISIKLSHFHREILLRSLDLALHSSDQRGPAMFFNENNTKLFFELLRVGPLVWQVF